MINLSAAQEERLEDIAMMRPRPRGTRASVRVLLKQKLIVWDGYRYVLTHYGTSVIAAIRARRGRL